MQRPSWRAHRPRHRAAGSSACPAQRRQRGGGGSQPARPMQRRSSGWRARRAAGPGACPAQRRRLARGGAASIRRRNPERGRGGAGLRELSLEGLTKGGGGRRKTCKHLSFRPLLRPRLTPLRCCFCIICRFLCRTFGELDFQGLCAWLGPTKCHCIHIQRIQLATSACWRRSVCLTSVEVSRSVTKPVWDGVILIHAVKKDRG